jgi:hypothetical protein
MSVGPRAQVRGTGPECRPNERRPQEHRSRAQAQSGGPERRPYEVHIGYIYISLTHVESAYHPTTLSNFQRLDKVVAAECWATSWQPAPQVSCANADQDTEYVDTKKLRQGESRHTPPHCRTRICLSYPPQSIGSIHNTIFI